MSVAKVISPLAGELNSGHVTAVNDIAMIIAFCCVTHINLNYSGTPHCGHL